MNEEKNSSFGKYDFIALVSLVIIIFSIYYLSVNLTGKTVQDTAILNVTIQALTAINFTTDFLYLGAGSVNAGNSYAIVDSEGTVVGGTGWGNTGNFTLENIGNTNVSLNLSVGKTAAQFIGGTNPLYQFKFANKEPNSCVNVSVMNTWLNTSTTGVALCSNFRFTDSSDTINIGVRLQIPSDSFSGNQTDVFTATATAI